MTGGYLLPTVWPRLNHHLLKRGHSKAMPMVHPVEAEIRRQRPENDTRNGAWEPWVSMLEVRGEKVMVFTSPARWNCDEHKARRIAERMLRQADEYFASIGHSATPRSVVRTWVPEITAADLGVPECPVQVVSQGVGR